MFRAFIITCLGFGLSTAAWANPTKTLLLSPDHLKAAWQNYALQRTAAGTPMHVVSLSEVAARYKGRDIQEKMRVCIRKHIDQVDVTAVILGGDSSPDGGLIPDRDTYHKNMWGNDTDIPSDLYYISPGSWDADGDGVYGEWADDKEEISYPDGSISIGRIPVRSIEDVQSYGNKVTAYLASISIGQAVGELTFTCAVQSAYPKVYRSATEFIPSVWKDGKVNIFFNDMTSWDNGKGEGSFDLSPKNFVGKINEGLTNKWHIHGHGLTDQWVLEKDAEFSIPFVKALKNIDNLPVITTVSCFTGNFDDEEDPCISEAMLRSPIGGAIAIVAPSREGKPHFHDPEKEFPLMVKEGKLDGTTQTMTSFWMAGLGEGRLIGHALSAAKASLADDAKRSATYHQGLCELNLLGDPTLPVR